MSKNDITIIESDKLDKAHNGLKAFITGKDLTYTEDFAKIFENTLTGTKLGIQIFLLVVLVIYQTEFCVQIFYI